MDEIEERNYDLKAVNPNGKGEVDMGTPAELLAEIERHNAEFKGALADLRQALKPTTRRPRKAAATRRRTR